MPPRGLARRRVRRILACASWLLASVLFAWSATSAPARQLQTVLQDDQLSLFSPSGLERHMRELRSLGVDQLRVSAEWKIEAPAPNDVHPPSGFRAEEPGWYGGPGTRLLDSAVRAANAAGLEIMVDPAFSAPRWATTDRVPRRDPGAAWFNTNISLGQAAAWEAMLARRYNGTYVPAGEKSPLPRVGTFTLWNEPNEQSFLKPQWRRNTPASADWYGRLARLAYPAIKRVSPTASVLIGNTSQSGSDEQVGTGGVAPLAFIRRLACVNRSLRPVHDGDCTHFTAIPADGFAHHPYERAAPPWVPSNASSHDSVQMGDLARLHRLLDRLVQMRRLAPGARYIWLTEQGYESDAELKEKPWSETQQSQLNAVSEYLAWREHDVRSFSQFLLRDTLTQETLTRRSRLGDPTATQGGTWTTGLMREGGRAKPAFWMFRSPIVVRAIPSPARGFSWWRSRLAEPRGSFDVEIWGRVRPARSPTKVELQIRGDQRENFRSSTEVRTDKGGIFDLTTRANLSACEFRFRWLDADGRWQTSPSARPIVVPAFP